MPRGKKICPSCSKEHGPRTHKCDCGHEFFKAAVAAPNEPMVLAKEHQETIGNVKSIIANVEARKASSPQIFNNPPVGTISHVLPASQTTESNPQVSYRHGDRRISVPAGFCPVKPRGYKSDKWEEPFTDEVVRDWAQEVYQSGPRYLPEAVVYFARYFWDINGADFNRVRSLILETLIPKNSYYEPDETDDEAIRDELAVKD